MQLILTHADLEAALINDLRSKGMTAFEPGKASVEFSFKRGTKELVCTMDTEAKAEVVPVTESPKATAEASAAPVEPVAEAVAEPAYGEPVAESAAEPVEAVAEAASDDNLFD